MAEALLNAYEASRIRPGYLRRLDKRMSGTAVMLLLHASHVPVASFLTKPGGNAIILPQLMKLCDPHVLSGRIILLLGTSSGIPSWPITSHLCCGTVIHPTLTT